MLEETRHQHTIPPLRRAEHILRAVAMVNVEVDDRYPFEAFFLERIRRCDTDIVENAKAHRSHLGRMVAAGPHRAERIHGPSGHHLIDRQ